MEEHVSVGGFWDGGIDSIKRLVTHFGLDRDLNGGRATLGEGKFEYAVDLPGIGKENIDVAVTGTTLRITGINAAKGKLDMARELPPMAAPVATSASYVDGVLRVVIQASVAPTVKIPVK